MTRLVSFLWHMHQPFYKDVSRNSYVMPWAYLHGAKDYYGMAALAGEFPTVHQTFNLVPSLLLQLEEYSSGQANDASFDLAFKPAEDLTPEERATILQQFFPVPIRTMIDPYPRYRQLWERRQSPVTELSVQDYRDIQAWWTLSWLDHDARPADLVEKGRAFTEDDKQRLRRLTLETIQAIIPTYRKRQEEGTIEVSTTPFYHPILPLLIDSRVDDPHVPVTTGFRDDAREQLWRARQFMRERFGVYPNGLWPSEGSVSDDVAAMAAGEGFQWMATDEGILAKSGVRLDQDRHRLFRPYSRHGITIFFRDRGFSDLIGFQYMHGPARDSAGDLVRRLEGMPEDSHVSIILDGENPWDYYPASGRDFLRFLYDGIARSSRLQAVTLSEAAKRFTPEPLNWLAPGSWANSNFAIWMGHPEDHEAWRWIARARAALMEKRGVVTIDAWNRAHEELLVAEGSDWMWWFGNDFSSDSDAVFDALFRQHIANIYRFIGDPIPEGLDEPIKKSLSGKRMVMAPPVG
ncbi:MAG TPA: glycoside hydrolase family 57 protein [Terriglobia bacterium]|nr:glycoside hydrolase family 57 protein [Terriglobia bacterium]